MSRNAVKRFGDFDVVNLDLCGCIVDRDNGRATDALSAVVELIRLQSVRRLSPWLFFLTTFASPSEINLSACLPLAEAIKENADGCSEFKEALQQNAGMDADGVVGCFDGAQESLPPTNQFIRIFALAVGKWLGARLRVPTPPSLVAMLPGYCFRHQNVQEPHLLSLAYLVKPDSSPGESGIRSKPGPVRDLSDEYRKHAKKMITKSFGLTDLDQMLEGDASKRQEAADETEHLLVSCGFDSTAVRSFLHASLTLPPQ
jgi:hypothetical protein